MFYLPLAAQNRSPYAIQIHFQKQQRTQFFKATMQTASSETEGNLGEDVVKVLTVGEWLKNEKKLDAMDSKLDFLISLMKNNSIASLNSLAESSITSSSSFQRVNSTGSVVSEDAGGSAPGSIISYTEEYLRACDKEDKRFNDNYDLKNHKVNLQDEPYFLNILKSKFPAWRSFRLVIIEFFVLIKSLE